MSKFGDWFRRKDTEDEARDTNIADLALNFSQWMEQFYFGGMGYSVPSQTLAGAREEIGGDYRGYVEGAYKNNGVIFACMLVRMLLFSEARFQYRRMRSGRPGDYFGTRELRILEKPWQNATTGDLLSRAMQDVDLAGNFYCARRPNNTLFRLRPDWVTIICGTPEGEMYFGHLDTKVLGYLYHPGGPYAEVDPIVLFPEEVVHFAPIPDPSATYRGMSWLTPVIREILGDNAASEHKLRFFENGATPNMVVSLDPSIQADKFKIWTEIFQAENEGLANAYKTLFLGGGADVQVVGANMQQVDFKVTQGAGETRIAAAAGVPPIIVGLSEGLQSATYSNYGQARRRFADGTMRPLWRNMAGSLSSIINIPNGAELWYDDRDIPFLAEDQVDAAAVQATQAGTINTLIAAGFDPNTVVGAVMAGDLGRLQNGHTGLVSVQLLPPGSVGPGKTALTEGGDFKAGKQPKTGLPKGPNPDKTVKANSVRDLRAELAPILNGHNGN